MWSSCTSRASCKISDLHNYFFSLSNFLSIKIAINRSKFKFKSWHILCEFLVPPELPAKFQRSSMTCEPPPPPLPQYVFTSICTSPWKKVFFCYRCFYQHWSRYLLSGFRIFFCFTDFFVLKIPFLFQHFLRKFNFQLILIM